MLATMIKKRDGIQFVDDAHDECTPSRHTCCHSLEGRGDVQSHDDAHDECN
jgi:hypothetical protein